MNDEPCATCGHPRSVHSPYHDEGHCIADKPYGGDYVCDCTAYTNPHPRHRRRSTESRTMKHELDWRSVRRVGTVWFSHGGNRWLRRTGPATWNVEQVATDEEVFALQGRRYIWLGKRPTADTPHHTQIPPM